MARQFLCSKTEPVVQTDAGKLRGFMIDGVFTFHGIKYADADRFCAPKPVVPWEGVQDALSYGYVCPLMQQDKPSGELLVPHRYWPMNEHCQYLNIWSPALAPAQKKPVMVWLHGGGFSAGSSIEQQAYDGEAMCRNGDVVVVSLNHRLNILGYLDLSSFGEKYKNSANAGNADLVAALLWIRDNIAAFGGDPDNVTLFGQSGGGMKVWSLMQTPSADGLFHKGIVQSGVIGNLIDTTKQDGRPLILAMLKALHLKEDQVDQLETLPYETLVAAYEKVRPEIEKAGGYVGCAPMPNDFYLGDPRVVGFCAHARSIPVMAGTVFGEFSFLPALSNAEQQNAELISKNLHARYGEETDQLITLFQAAYPEKPVSDLLYLDSLFRAPTMDFILKKAAHQEAPTYSYLFTYTFPFDDGHVAWHCSEIPFVFHNAALVPVCNAPGVTDTLEQAMFSAWISFARQGNPNNSTLPQWDACTPGTEPVMVFDRECTVRTNFDHSLISLHEKLVPPFSFGGDQEIQH